LSTGVLPNLTHEGKTMERIIKNFQDTLTEYGIQISDMAFHKNIRFIEMLLQANQTVNLTSITDFEEALYKHLLDAFLITQLPFWRKTSTIIDIGSGAGIPAIPLAIIGPKKKVISMDATQKKVNFQREISQTLGLSNLQPLWGRAEELGKQAAHREQYDLVLARAVAAVNVLAELTIPFARPTTGIVCLYKGKDYREELQFGQKAIETLGGKVIDCIETDLPQNYGARAFIVIQKTKSTAAQYPRRIGIPQKNPLS
jgi:16S rRNA (guanine527-N7)-methyltransferase